MSTKNCKHATCDGEFCRREPKPKKVNKPIAKFSDKRKKINRTQYQPAAAAFVKANPVCAIKQEGCTGKTQGVHHVRGKSTIELLLDESNWLPACNHCNSIWIEQNSKEAFEKGFKKSKYL